MNFNSRPSARGDRRGRLPLQKLLNFNSRPSARGDIRGCVYRGIELFQFTPLREGRPLEVFAQDVEFLISIHAPPRGATGTGRITSLTRMYFNSRPSARGDRTFAFPDSPAILFQFTPLREGRRALDYYKKNAEKFQFTPLREGRLDWTDEDVWDFLISIHAPPRGATMR